MVLKMMDFGSVMKVKGAWDQFSQNHPKFVPFMQAVGREAIADGTIIEIKVTSPAGKEYNTNMAPKSGITCFQPFPEYLQRNFSEIEAALPVYHSLLHTDHPKIH